VNAATNRLTKAYYDANGNMTSGAGATFTYDEANRIATVTETSGGETFYGYDASNKRIYTRSSGQETFTFYGAKGEKLGVYSGLGCPGSCMMTAQKTNLWFGGRLVATMGAQWMTPQPVFQDRVGTNRETGNYYPYGEGVAGTDNLQFATYTRDSYSGLDYADQRFYASSYGRFLTADPFQGVAKGASDPDTPASWNKYAYTLGDPVNNVDPRGMFLPSCDPDGGPCWGGGFGWGWGPPCTVLIVNAYPCSPQTYAPAQPAAPPCTAKYSPGSLAFIETNYAAALDVASEDSLPVAWMLAWGAQESGWGTNPRVAANGNFLNETSTPKDPTGGWVGATPCPAGARPGYACFGSFQDSLSSALDTVHKTWTLPNGTTPAGGVSALQVIQAVLQANPTASEAAVFQAIADNGYDRPPSPSNAGYGSRVATTDAASRINCLQSLGLLP